MDLRLVEIFCLAYGEGSFSRAAHALGLTQPTVSAHIKELEASLGTRLFNRLGRDIEPTEAGRFLYQHAQALRSLKREIAEQMAGFLNRVEGVLTIGASSAPGEHLLPKLVTDFRTRHSGIRARLRISDTARTIEDVRHGGVELGVVGGTVPDDDLVFEPVADDVLVLAVPTSAQWPARASLSLRELRRLPLLVREAGSGTRTVLERALARRKLALSDFNVAAELGSAGAIREAVKAGHGMSFVSQLAMTSESRAGTVRLMRVRELGVIRRSYHTVVSRRRMLAPVTHAFLEYLRQHSPLRGESPRRSRHP